MLLLLLSLGQSVPPGGAWEEQFTFAGTEANARFGTTLDWIGDVDGDGVGDLLVNSPAYPTGVSGSTGGASFLYSGTTGVELAQLIGSFVPPPWSFAKCGSRLGDITGDGKPEIAIGKPSSQWGALPAIQVYSVLPWTLVYEVQAPSQPSALGVGNCAGGTDLNGDGWPDLVAADPYFEANGVFATGAVHAFNGVDGSLLWRVSGPGSSDFGGTVSCPGDVNGDGYADVITRSQIYPGTVHALSGLDGGELYRFHGDYLYGFIGASRLSPCGDADGDGLPDYIVGQAEDPGVSNGMATIHRGYDGAIIHRWEGPIAGEDFGFRVGGPGDVNGDGWPDYLVSAWRGQGLGRVYLYSGRDFSLMKTLYSPSTTPSSFGFTLSNLGSDINGDGSAEVVIADPSEPVNGLNNAGAVYMFSFDRFLRTDAREVSASNGGTIHFTLDFPASEAGMSYRLLASADQPGSLSYGGVGIPLVMSGLLKKMLTSPPPLFDFPAGTLDANGDALVTATFAPGTASALIGRTLKFAAVSLLSPTQPSRSSAPAWVEITP